MFGDLQCYPMTGRRTGPACPRKARERSHLFRIRILLTRPTRSVAADGIYVIQADGDLGLYDSEGLIRVAKKIE